MNYFEPDERWEFTQNVKSREDFLERFVVKGKFHDKVPQDIVDAWETVEYLMAHSFYHWQMYDEALKKAFLTIEMAVKLKAKNIGIKLKKKPNKNGFIQDKRLVDLIDEVFVGEHYTYLKNDLSRARKLRNYQAHPESNTYMGGTCNTTFNFMLIVNILNNIFYPDKVIEKYYDENHKVAEILRGFNKKVIVYESDKPGILLHGIIDFRVLDTKLCLAIDPIRTNIKELLDGSKFPETEMIIVDNYTLEEDVMTGYSKDGILIKFFITDKEKNKKMFDQYIADVTSCDNSIKALYAKHIKGVAAWQMVVVEYLDEK